MNCGTSLPGIFVAQPGTFGAQRISIAINR
jgi:hypothetical protein